MCRIPSYFRGILLILFIFLQTSSFATHIVGADLFYSYVSGNTYQITLVAYGDCAGSSFPALPMSTPVICIYDANTSVASITLALQAPTNGIEITPVCPADTSLTQCTNASYAIPGIKKFVYTGNYTLPYTSSTWRFLFTGYMGASGGSAGRGSGITNILSPGTSIIQLVDTLNNTVYHNTNPALTVLPTPFFCLSSGDNYNPGAHDIDGDSLIFSLITANNGTASCSSIGGTVTYASGYTGATPLATSAYAFNPYTGQISFTPSALQRSLVVYNIDEYRTGTFVGSCQREMTFLVLTCTDIPPTGGFVSSTSGTIVDSSDFNICQNAGSFSVTLKPTEVDTFNNIIVSASGLPTGAVFTTTGNGTPHPICTFSWNTTLAAIGSYTFYITFQDNNCPLSGTQTRAYTINVLPYPIVDAGPNVSICQGASTSLSATGTTSYTWLPGTGLSCISCTSPIANPGSTTLYTVTGTATNGCTNTDTVRVTIKTIPAVSAGLPVSICPGSSTTLNATGGVSYTWLPGSTLSCSTCSNPIATPATTTIYSLTGVGANGCINTNTVTVTVNPIPIITAPPVSVCSGNSVILYPAGGVSYTWSPGTGLSCTACTNPVAGPASTAIYTVTGRDINGCINTATVTVTVAPIPPTPAVVSPVNYCQFASSSPLSATGTALLWYTTAIGGIGNLFSPIPGTGTVGTTKWYVSQTVGGCESPRDSISVVIKPLPTISISPTAATICSGQSTTFSASGGVSYTWSPTTSLSSGVSPTVTANPATTTVYNVVGIGANGCSNNANITVTVHPLPLVTVTPTAPTICIGSSVVLTASGAVAYNWSPSTGLSSGAGTSVTASPVTTTTYLITGTDANLCVNTASVTVTVNPIPPAPTVITPIIYCQNATARVLTATGSGLLWYVVATGGTSTTSAPLPNTTTPGTFMWYVSQTVGGCESPRSSISVLVNPIPVVTLSPATPTICEGQEIGLNASGATTYTWSPGTGLTTVTGAHELASPSITTTYSVIGTDGNNCSAKATITVVVHQLPNVSITPAHASMCIGSSETLTATGAATYIWTPADMLNTNTGATVITTPTVSVIYSVTGTDAFGCVNTSGTTILVYPIPLAPIVSNPVFYCQHAPAIPLVATGTSLLWYTVPTGGIGSSIDPTPGTDIVGTFLWYVSQTVNGCESPRDTLNVIITVNAETDFDYTVKYGCVEDTVTFTNNSQNAYKYLWTFGTKPISTDTSTNPIHYFIATLDATYYTVKLLGKNPVCYQDSTTKTITINGSPHIYFLNNLSPDATIQLGSTTQLNVDGGSKYLWSPNDGSLSNPNINNPQATPVDDITYIVKAFDQNGCQDSGFVNIKVFNNDSEFIPSAFSPNGDGLNDIFKIGNLKYSKLEEFSIYNRWGQLVFKTNDPLKGWDGFYQGVPQDLGVYNYLVVISRPDKTQFTMKGNVTLIR